MRWGMSAYAFTARLRCASVGELETSRLRRLREGRFRTRLDCRRRLRASVKVRAQRAHFRVDCAKAGANRIHSTTTRANFFHAPRSFKFEKAHTEIGFMEGNPCVGTPGCRSKIGEAARGALLQSHVICLQSVDALARRGRNSPTDGGEGR